MERSGWNAAAPLLWGDIFGQHGGVAVPACQPRRRLQGIKVTALTSSADRKRGEERNGGRNEGRRGHGKLVVVLLLGV